MTTNINKVVPIHQYGRVRLDSSLKSNWTEIEDLKANIDSADADSSLLLAGTDLEARVIAIPIGSSLIFRLKYNDSITAVTNPVIRIVGVDEEGNQSLLENKASTPTTDITLTTEADDLYGFGFAYTKATSDVTVDNLGHSKFYILIKTALSATGIVTTARVQYKII